MPSGIDPGDGATDAPDGGAVDNGGASTSTDSGDGSAAIAPSTGGLSLIVEPSDKAAALLQAISQAKTSIHMTMYLLGDKRFSNALIAQKKANKDVKVLLNESFPTSGAGNQAAFDALSTAGVSVEWAPATFALTHEKCVIIDGDEAWIMTMNLEASSPENREFIVVDHRPADVQEAEAVFDADWNRTSFTPSGDLVVAPVNARAKLRALVEAAKTSVDLEGEELSDRGIVQDLVAAETRGVAVRIVLASGSSSPAQTSAVQTLKAGNVAVSELAKPYVHAKAMVVDGTQAYVGSENFTANSLDKNRELGLLTDDASVVSQLQKTIAADFAASTSL